MKTFKDLLIELNACSPAIEWAEDKTIEEVLRDSYRGDWLLWLAKKLDLPLNKLTLAKSRCAKTVIHLMKNQKSIYAVNIAERFGLDECTLEELNAAAYAASAAAYADAAAYAADAAYDAASYADAYAAAYAADAYAAASYAAATAAAADAAAATAAATAAASAAAYAADAAAARKNNQQHTSDICVEILGQLLIDAVNNNLKK